MDYYPPTQRAPSAFFQASIRRPTSIGVLHLRHARLPSSTSPTADTALDEAMWRMTLQPLEGMEASEGPYPVRPGEPDCAYYMRTGLCGFGTTCRFNHPPNRRLVSGGIHGQGEYPERIGQQECQYYLKTGTCKFGATCKFHHPRNKAGLLGRAPLNILNLPLRPGEKDCAYYMRTGGCKFGATCKFHHPQPTAVGPLVSPLFSPAEGQAASTQLHQPYPSGLHTWQIVRGAVLPSTRMQAPSTFAPMLLSPHQSLWNTYQSSVGTLTSPDAQQQSLGSSYVLGAATQQDPVAGGVHATFSPYMQASGGPLASSTRLKDSPYPSRPGQPECQYYMKTGECKFGGTCKFHHPRDRSAGSAPIAFSPMGLPLRPGVPPCAFYTRNGFCKFGPTCKFDHPLVGLPLSAPTHSLVEMPTISISVTSPSTVLAPTLPPEVPTLRQTSRTGLSSEMAVSSETQARNMLSLSRENVEENGPSAVQTGEDLSRGKSPSLTRSLSTGSTP